MGRFGPRKSAFIRAMQRRGILVRDRSTDYGCVGCVRITLGTAEQTERLLTALRTTLKEIGVNKARAK